MIGLMILFLSIFIAVSVDINFWGLLLSLIIFIALLWGLIKTFLLMLNGTKVGFWVVKKKD